MHIARLMIEIIIIIIVIRVNLKQEKLVHSLLFASVKLRIKTTTLMFLVP